MSEASDKNTHPGAYVRQNVIPKDMTVTKAAELLGVGRPALSNFLNGKAALSPDMARRLESAFGAERQKLLDLQARYAHENSAQGQPIVTGIHAPTLCAIKAHHIESWADKTEARRELPALLRRLIHSTGPNLSRVDFPAYDNAERKGWDGETEAETPTPWIPKGKSGWEFGCSSYPQRKAEQDYAARVKSVSPEERSERAFVFVTPRNWPRKKQWAKEKAALGHWQDVRAYDASDLEQWLEQSAPTQIWFAEQAGLTSDGYQSLERRWRKWASVCEPELSPALFDTAIERFSKDFKSWLSSPPDRPLIVAADSRDEALAFLACLAEQVEIDAGRMGDRALVIDAPKASQRFDASDSTQIIAVIRDQSVEKEMGDLHRRCHCVIVRPRNERDLMDKEPDIVLETLRDEDFKKALEKMKLPPDEIKRLTQDSACSPTILRRLLSLIPAIKTPAWASDEKTVRKLIPATLVGAWHDATSADREIMRRLAGVDEYRELEKNAAALLALEDPPLWAIGGYRGVVSRIDALFGIARAIAKSDLENFFFVAECILSEKDPALELPEDERWMAPIYGKARDHSDALRHGVRETLILLAVYGNRLFHSRLGLNVEQKVASLIVKLLTPLNAEKILSSNEDLKDYAEAAPEEFLKLLEDDLRKCKPTVLELMRPSTNFMVAPRRTKLLRALENLAWSPQRFPRVVEALAKLRASGEPGDNWMNTPANTLQSLFVSWLPQTAASIDDRLKTLGELCRRHPTLGWAVCVRQLADSTVATPNTRPRWRDDAKGAGYGVSVAERSRFVLGALDLALAWPRHNEKTLEDLVKQIDHFPPEIQQKTWDIIDQWADQTESEDAKAILRRRIQECARFRRLRKNLIAHPERERATLAKLLPEDILIRHAWLFTSYWVDLPLDESEDEDTGSEEREQRALELRIKAMREIWAQRGFDGVSDLLEKIKAEADLVGGIMGEILAARREKTEFVKRCLQAASDGNDAAYKTCLVGLLWNADSDFTDALVKEIEHSLKEEDLLTLFLSLPFQSATWRRFDDKPEKFREAYWRNVHFRRMRNRGEDETGELIDRLIEVDRAPAAFNAISFEWSKVETPRLKRLLGVLLQAGTEEVCKMTSYRISEAFDALDKRPGVPVEEKARLEFAYLPFLEREQHGIPNLEDQIAKSPELYAQAIACAYRRDDGKEDPPESPFNNAARQERVALSAFNLLRAIKRIPGSDEQGNIDAEELKKWIERVRSLNKDLGRAESGDRRIGELLERAPVDDDGVWPCRPICEALEWISSKDVGYGFIIGAQNSRGVYWKSVDEGGGQERDLAARYRGWAGKLACEYPYVSGLLESIAKSYDDIAGQEDDRSDLRRRLPFK